MAVYSINPLTDPRWDALLADHPRAAVFHTRGWLQALQRTYGYQPIVLTTSGPLEPLRNGLVFCQLESWISGRRLVSLPFSDHCDPLIDSVDDERKLLEAALEFARETRCRYTEIRPSLMSWQPVANSWCPSERFRFHALSLQASEQELFSRMHSDCIRRKVRRAEKERLEYIQGTERPLLHDFYELLVQTRGRHGVPPPPMEWFRDLFQSMNGCIKIRIAAKDGRPVAAILTLDFRTTVTYKYGGSDDEYNHLGGMPFLFWKLIQEARQQGMRLLDLGRSGEDNPGLITFKNRLGANSDIITYWRGSGGHPVSPCAQVLGRVGKLLFRSLPRPILIASGRILYKHAG
jgi:CelD/BcsL family acetyltransferase involved in cellulose biosynthesis